MIRSEIPAPGSAWSAVEAVFGLTMFSGAMFGLAMFRCATLARMSGELICAGGSTRVFGSGVSTPIRTRMSCCRIRAGMSG
jgi:hypothetical protein